MSTTLLCPDCVEFMRLVEYDERYCKAADILVGIEEQMCLKCGTVVYNLTNVRPLGSEDEFISRIEDLNVTCCIQRILKPIPQETLINLVKHHLVNNIVSLCRKLFKDNWVDTFELVLWEALKDADFLSMAEAKYKEVSIIRHISDKLNIWVVNARYWANVEGNGLMVIPRSKWVKMVKNKNILLATHEFDKTGGSQEAA